MVFKLFQTNDYADRMVGVFGSAPALKVVYDSFAAPELLWIVEDDYEGKYDTWVTLAAHEEFFKKHIT